MTRDSLTNQQSIDIEYGDFISSLQDTESDATNAERGDGQVKEMNDDDHSDFSIDKSDDRSAMESQLSLQNYSVQKVCYPSQETILTQIDCSNLNTLLVSLSDVTGYDRRFSSAWSLPQPIEEIASSESPTPPLDTSSATPSEDCKVVSEGMEHGAIEYTSDMHDGLQLLDSIQQARQSPNFMGSHMDAPFDEEIHVPATVNSVDREIDREPISEIVAPSSSNQRTKLSVGQQQPNDDSFRNDGLSPMEKRKEYFVETSFLSTVLDDETLSDWDAASFDQGVQENKKRKCRKWQCYLVGNGLLVVIICVMSTLIGVSVFGFSNSENQAVVATPSFAPTGATSDTSPSYSQKPVNRPSEQITWSMVPSRLPTMLPSPLPSSHRSMVPSSLPTMLPSPLPSSNPTHGDLQTTFYAIGDVPYNNLQKIRLRDRMINLPDDGEFLIHVGDIRSGEDKVTLCRLEEYEEVRDILLQSDIPVFIIPGDNEWIDCPNPVEGRHFWRQTFNDFDKNWNHPFQVVRHPLRPENFYFVHKRTLYFGLNLVTGRSFDFELYSMQLEDNANFVKSMIDQQVVAGDVTSVVLFGHAFPRNIHDVFFVPLRKYIHEKLGDKVPFLYLNGDKHKFDFEQNYLGLSNFQRLQVDFGTSNPPLKVAVSSSSRPGWNATDTFAHDRMLLLDSR